MAFGVTEVDLIRIIAKEKGEDVTLIPEAFMSQAAYNFPPSMSINTPVGLPLALLSVHPPRFSSSNLVTDWCTDETNVETYCYAILV